MGNQVRPRRGASRASRASDRRKTQPKRRKVEMITLAAEAHCGPSGKRRGRGLRSLFRIGFVALLLFVPIFIATTTFGYATTLDPPPESPYWDANSPQAHGDPQRSGSSGFALAAATPDLRWTATGYAPFLAGPVMDEANVYVVDRKGVVSARNLTTGDEVWRVDLKQEVRATPALGYGWLYVATEAKELHALSAQSGTIIHNANLAGAARAPPLVAEGRIFIGTETGKLQVLDATTLDEIWSFETSTKTYHNGTVDEADPALLKPIRAPPATYKGQLYLGAWNARGYALSTTGNLHGQPSDLVWTRTLTDLVHAAPTVDRHRDLVYFATGDGRLEALHRGSGTLSWWIDAGDAFAGGVAVNETRLVAATTDGRLLGVDPSTGRVLWEQYEPSGYIAGPTLLDDAVVTLSANGTLTLRAPTDGAVLNGTAGTPYRWKLSDGAHATPAVTKRGIVVVDQGGTISLVGPRPDLRADLRAAVKTIGNVTTEAPITLSATLQNLGPDIASETTATLYLGEKAIDTLALGRLNATATHVWNHTVSLSPGQHTLKVVLHSDGARDPTPEDGVGTLRLDLDTPAAQDEALDDEGAIDLEELYGRDLYDDTGSAPTGFLDGMRRAWTLWMVPVGLFAAVGGVMLGRYVRERMRPSASAD